METIMSRCVLRLVVGAAMSMGSLEAAKAQDAEFGCKVLLCAAASNPSWPSIAYCVPVMNQLYSMMRSIRFRWPVCTAARTGAPGYEPYQPCPAGWQAASINIDGGDNGVTNLNAEGNGDLCARALPSPPNGQQPQATTSSRVIRCSGGGGDNGNFGGSGHGCLEYIQRPRNERPYFFDVRNADGNMARIWFNVR